MRHILSLGEQLMSSERPISFLSDQGMFSSAASDSTTTSLYCSRSSLNSVSLSSSCLSMSSIPVGKPLKYAKDYDPGKIRENLLLKVKIIIFPYSVCVCYYRCCWWWCYRCCFVVVVVVVVVVVILEGVR